MLNLLITRGKLTLTRETTDSMVGYILGDGEGGVILLRPLVAADVANAIMDDLEGAEASAATAPGLVDGTGFPPLPALPSLPPDMMEALSTLAEKPSVAILAQLALMIQRDAGTPMKNAHAIEEALDLLMDCGHALKERTRQIAEVERMTRGEEVAVPFAVEGSIAKRVTRQEVRDAVVEALAMYKGKGIEFAPSAPKMYQVLAEDVERRLFADVAEEYVYTPKQIRAGIHRVWGASYQDPDAFADRLLFLLGGSW